MIAFFIVATMFDYSKNEVDEWQLSGTSTALVLRLGSIVVDLMLWTFLNSNVVREFFAGRSHPPERAFEVIMTESCRSS